MGRRICRHERKEVTGRLRKLYKEELHNLYFSRIIVKVIKSTGHPLKVVVLVPFREHLVEQLSFPVVMQTNLVFAVTEVHPAVD
jgi:hypothetical protein